MASSMADGDELERLEDRLTGWPEDRWREEIEKHPFFAKRAYDDLSGELPPLIDGLAQLKYDPEHNTPRELALSYKEDGNFYYKNKKYRIAVYSYTEGLKVGCTDNRLEAELYNNRSACHLMLENYRSSLRDCENALKLDSSYLKPLPRAARCAFALLEFSSCVNYCKLYLANTKCDKTKKIKQKAELILDDLACKEDEKRRVLDAVQHKNIKMMDPSHEDADIEVYLSAIPSLERSPCLNEVSYEITWPIVILYPEKQVYDYYQSFVDSNTLGKLLDEILATPPEWDDEKKYNPNSVDMFYIGKSADDLIPVNLNKPLEHVMMEDTFYLRNLSPTFVLKLKR